MEGIISKETCSVRRFFGLLDNIQTKLERLAEDNRPLFNGERFLSAMLHPINYSFFLFSLTAFSLRFMAA